MTCDWYVASVVCGELTWIQFGTVLFRAKYPGPIRFKSAFLYSTRLPPNTACAELDSGLIEKSLWSAFIARSAPPSYISKTFLRRCLWPVVLRKAYFDHVANGRVVQDGFVQSRVVQGRRNFRRTNYNGSNCTEASCPEPSCSGTNGPWPLWQSVYTEPSVRGSACQNVVFQILNTGKSISRKAVHVVILGVTIAFCEMMHRLQGNQTLMIKYINMHLVKNHIYTHKRTLLMN